MEFIRDNWGWISSNLWGAISIFLAGGTAGWGLAQLHYGERIEILKAKAEGSVGGPLAQEAEAQPRSAINYPESGRHGFNVLSERVHVAKVGEDYSMRAEIPVGSRLRVRLAGEPSKTLNRYPAAWEFSLVGVENWKASNVVDRFADGVLQDFNAEDGRAELQLRFGLAGVVTVEVYEGGERQPWQKEITVTE